MFIIYGKEDNKKKVKVRKSEGGRKSLLFIKDMYGNSFRIKIRMTEDIEMLLKLMIRNVIIFDHSILRGKEEKDCKDFYEI